MNKENEIRSAGKLITLHLLPGFVLGIVYLLILKLRILAGLPKIVTVSLAGSLSILPIELGYLLYVARKEEGSFNIFKILGLKSKMRLWEYIVYTLSLFILAGILMTVLKPLTNYIANTVFYWIPSWYNYVEDLSQFDRNAIIITILVNFFFMTLAGPITEELYFRGYLLARMKWMGKYSVLLNVILFSVYHFWSPWLIIARIAVMLPLYYCVYKKDSLKLAIIVHCLVNFTDVVSLLSLI
ncbi:MAG TPA: CPBP family intramembrane glutamic endopeptidase [Clostridia bacterium]|nr:CPBP family intramembrane glutamic endopeptidase [Clostridia bacterium]